MPLSRLAWLVLLIVAPCAPAQEPVQPEPLDIPPQYLSPQLFADADAQQLWVLHRPEGNGFRLLHQPERATDNTLYEDKSLTRKVGRPIALAAMKDRVFIAFGDRTTQRYIYNYNTQIEQPVYTLKQTPPLPTDTTLIDWEAAQWNPIALVLREAEDTEPTVQMLSPQAGQWQPVALPDGVTPDAHPQLVVLDRDAGRLAIVTQRNRRLTIHRSLADGWTDETYTRDTSDPPDAAICVSGHVVILDHLTEPLRLKATLLYPDGRALDAGELPLPNSPSVLWDATAEADGITVIARDIENRFYHIHRTIGLSPNTSTEPLHVTGWPRPHIALQLFPMLMLLIMAMTIVTIWRRGQKPDEIKLPDDVMPTPLGKRFTATLIDLSPPVVVAMVLFGISNPMEVLAHWPKFEQPSSAMLPGFVVIGLTVLHTAISEALTGTSLGKRSLGCRVITTDGHRPSVAAVLLRCGLKAVELIIYPLLLFVLLSPLRQRMGDVASRTVVVNPKDDPQDGSADKSS